MPSKETVIKNHIAVRKACNDVVCAVYENPNAFENLVYVKPEIRKPLPSSYRHLGIIGVAIAGVAKFIGYGLH